MTPNPEATAFLHLVDRLDTEANAVTHVVVTAQVTMNAMLDGARDLLCQGDMSERAVAEMSVRFMQQRAALTEALAAIRRAGQPGVATEAAVSAVGIPVPPRPKGRAPGAGSKGSELVPDASGHRDARRSRLVWIEVPDPPAPRLLAVAPAAVR